MSMLSNLRECARLGLIAINPFYRNPIQRMPGSVNIETPGVALPNPHVAIDNIVSIFKHNRAVADSLRMLDGTHLLVAVVEENAIDRGTLWVNVFRLRSSFTTEKDFERVCAGGWKEHGMYHFFAEIEHDGLRCRSSIKAIKDERTYSSQYNPFDPEQTWGIELNAAEMALLGFGK